MRKVSRICFQEKSPRSFSILRDFFLEKTEEVISI